MISRLSPEKEFLKVVLDANPDLMFVVDEDMGILEFNQAAGRFFSAPGEEVISHKGGDALHCVHSTETPKGCGHSLHCQTCLVRNSVKEAFGGQRVVRRGIRMELLSGGKIRELHMLITASPFEFEERRLVLLVMEDMTELEEIRRLIPICSKCKKIRDDDQYWAEVENYFKKHLGVNFTHGLCPQCFAEFTGEIKQYMEERSSKKAKK